MFSHFLLLTNYGSCFSGQLMILSIGKKSNYNSTRSHWDLNPGPLPLQSSLLPTKPLGFVRITILQFLLSLGKTIFLKHQIDVGGKNIFYNVPITFFRINS